jgi:hypothetical protein
VLSVDGRALGQAGTQLPGLEGGVGAAVEAGDNPQRTSIAAALVSTEVAHQFTFRQDYSGEGRARAETFGGARPMAVAESELQVSVTRIAAGFAEANAGADLTYRMRINQRRTPPITFQPRLRILAKTRGEVTADSSGARGYASAQAFVQFGFAGRTFRAVATSPLGTGAASFDEQFIIDYLRPGEILPIRLTATVESGANSLFPGSYDAVATALVDPEFSFDEIAFAEYAMQEGFAPFRQADYYEFEFSEGVLVPEPPSIVLAAMSVAFFVAWKRKARLNRRTA